jgi:hypothetical protein
MLGREAIPQLGSCGIGLDLEVECWSLGLME